MRYYSIIIKDQNGKVITVPSSVPGTGATYTSYANGKSIPGALQIEFDIPLRAYGTPMRGSLVRVWGISLQEIGNANQLNPTFNKDGTTTFKSIEIYGGMKPGLPLATAAAADNQAGLLVSGSVYQAFGNWLGTDQSLDIMLAPDFGTNNQPKNIVLNWPAGQQLWEAIDTTLSTAFPNYGRNFNINQTNLVLNSDQTGFYKTLEQFAAEIKAISAAIIGGTYQGVDIFFSNGDFQIVDGTVQATPKQIKFQDLIGQPTWIEGPAIQFKCPVRADISIGTVVKMPKAVITTTAAAPTALVNLRSAFEGQFYVNEIRHVGNFRQPDAACWVTSFNAAPMDIQGNGAEAGPTDDF